MIEPGGVPPQPPDRHPGVPYQLERLLNAEGGMSRYLAHDTRAPHRLLALDVWPAPATTAERLQQEAAYLRGLLHVLQQAAVEGLIVPHVLEAPAAPGMSFCLVAEYVPGLTLREEVEEGDGILNWRTYVDWATDLCLVLRSLHALQPAYVLGSLHLSAVKLALGSGRPLVIDPGLYRRAANTSIVHPGYVPFEQVLGREEPRSDIYALGAVLHSLLSAQDPDAEYVRLRRSGLDVQRTLRALFPPLDARSLRIPDALAALVGLCTAFTLEDRFPDAGALLAALQAVRGPAAAVDTFTAPEPSDDPVWARLGLTQDQWFSLPVPERNRLLLKSLRT